MAVIWSLRLALRVSARSPLTTVAVVLLTSLGIASVLTILGPLYSLVLSPLPLPEADRLVRLGGGIPLFNVYTNKPVDVDQVRPVLSHLAAFAPTTESSNGWRLPDDQRVEKVLGVAVTPNFFETLGVAPRLGTTLLDAVDDTSAVVISERLWRTLFDARSNAIGKPVNIGGRHYAIAGVMPAAFGFPYGVDAWIPIGEASYLTSGIEIIGRLRSDVSMSRATEWLETRKPRPQSTIPNGQFAPSGPVLQRLSDYLRGDTRNRLLIVFAASTALVLLCCAGVINLLLARSANRRSEVAVQLALGAGRWRLVRQSLLETWVLVVVGASVGLWLSGLGRRWLQSQVPDLAIEWPLTPMTMGVVVVVVVLVTLWSGLPPALYSTRAGKVSLLTGRAVTFSARRRLSPIDVLAASQLALAVGLLTCAALLGRSLYLQVRVPLGFTSENVFSFRTALARPSERLAAEAAFQKQYAGTMSLRDLARATFRAAKPQIAAEYQRNRLFLRQLIERLEAMPSVMAVGVLSPTPFSKDAAVRGRAFANFVSSQSGPQAQDDGQRVPAISGFVTQAAFDVLGVRFLAGRPFSTTEIEDAFESAINRIGEANTPHPPYPAIVNGALARRIWPDVNPVGRYFNTSDHKQAFRVVGVVADFQWTPGVPVDRPAVYRPFDGAALTADVILRVRPKVPISGLLHDIDTTVTALATDASHVQIQALDEMVSAEQHDLRVVLTLIVCFATVGIVVAALGIFTAASLLVRSTTHELGIRLALGASPTRIRQVLLLQMGRTLVGFPVGWFLGWLLAKQLSHYLPNVAKDDLTGYVASSVVAGVAILASLWVPLLRASRIDPMGVLRQE